MEYKSVLKEEIMSFLGIIKESRAKSTYKHYVCTMNEFDSWLIQYGESNKIVNENCVVGWIKNQNGERSTINAKIYQIKNFLKYLDTLSIAVYIPTTTLKVANTYQPYYFSDEELREFISVADNLCRYRNSGTMKSDLLHIEFPMILRIMCGCGSRATETISLQVGDLDFDNGLIRFTNSTKNSKQRTVPIHETLTNIIKDYCVAMNVFGKPEEYLFPASSKDRSNCISEASVSHMFREKFLHDIRKSQNLKKNERGACIHCVRHTFAFRSFCQYENDGKKANLLIPYLSIYLGHENLYETQKYLNFNSVMYPEVNQKFSDFSNELFPEVKL